MVLTQVDKIMPIYVENLFDSDWLLWIYEVKDAFDYLAISKDDITDFEWEFDKFTFV